MAACDEGPCGRPATMAVRLTRPSRPDLRITVYAGIEAAPKSATPYCNEHGTAVVTDLMKMVCR